MSFPKTLDELRVQGYRFDNEAACRGCGARIEWFTTPRGKKLPMDVDSDGNAEAHFANCPNAQDFRKRDNA